MTRHATLALLALLTVTAGLAGAVGATPPGTQARDATHASDGPAVMAQGDQTTNATAGRRNRTANATLDFPDQRSNGSSLAVRSVNLSAGGFLVFVSRNRTLLGNSSYLEPGRHENLTVTLDEPLNGSQVVAVSALWDTNGNRTIDFNVSRAQRVGVSNATDRPYLQSNGRPVNAVAFVIVANATSQTNSSAANSAVRPA